MSPDAETIRKILLASPDKTLAVLSLAAQVAECPECDKQTSINPADGEHTCTNCGEMFYD